jgi:hypothetical protein
MVYSPAGIDVRGSEQHSFVWDQQGNVSLVIMAGTSSYGIFGYSLDWRQSGNIAINITSDQQSMGTNAAAC